MISCLTVVCNHFLVVAKVKCLSHLSEPFELALDCQKILVHTRGSNPLTLVVKKKIVCFEYFSKYYPLSPASSRDVRAFK